MTLDEATRILGAADTQPFYEDGALEWALGGEYNWWEVGSDTIVLDGGFTADQLEAFATFMRLYKAKDGASRTPGGGHSDVGNP